MKGASHVDWAISMGIFILYVLSLFIFLKPGVQPDYRGDELLDIVENGLNNDVHFTMKKIPVFIQPINIENGDYLVNANFDINNKFPFCGENQDFALIDDNNYLRFSLNGDDNNCFPNGKNMKFDAYLDGNDKNVFWLLYFNESSYNLENPVNTVEAVYENSDEDNISITFGVTQEIKGISLEKLQDLSTIEYNDLKTKWGFPLEREFSLYIINSTKADYSQDDIIFEYNKVEIPDQTSVFVKEIKDIFLNNMSGESNLIINIRIF